MKEKLLSVIAALAFLPAMADDYAREVLEEFLDARSAEDPVRYARVAKSVAEFAAKGNPLHQYVLAVTSREADFPAGIGLSEKDREYYILRNRRRISALADKGGNALAYYLLSLEKNDMSLLHKAAKGGNVYALNELGARIMSGIIAGKTSSGTGRKLSDCHLYFSLAADKRDPTALYNLGVCSLNGYGCPKDTVKALEYFNRAAEMNHPRAMNALGEMYRDGVDVEQDMSKAIGYFADSVRSGNSYCQYNYALALLKDGGNTGTNAARAVEFLKKSAMQRNLQAMNAYAGCLYDSVGVDVAYTNALEGAELADARAKIAKEEADRAHQAVAWWLHCADKFKHPPAMHSLARCFMEGRGVDRNEQAAVAWYKRAADLGHTPSMFSIADCCEHGIGGMKKSHYNANWWKTRAHAEMGERNARVWLDTHKLQ